MVKRTARIKLPDPVFVQGQWCVDMDGPAYFTSRDKAVMAMRDRLHHPEVCLYQGCLNLGTYLQEGKGFRFCWRHGQAVRELLDRTSKRSAYRVFRERKAA